MVRRCLAAVAAGSVMVVALLACVGEDPTLPDGDTSDAGSDGSTTGQDALATPSDSGSGGGDGSTDASVDGAFDVRTIPNLRLWLEASLGVTRSTDYVTSWTDSSGRWGDAGADGGPDGGVHRATVKHGSGPMSSMPTWIDSDIGGRPVVKTWGGGDPTNGYYLGIPNHPDFAPGTGDWLMAGVVKLGQGNGAGQIWSLMTTGSGTRGIEITAGGTCVTHPTTFGQSDCTAPALTLVSTESHVFVARRVGASLTYRVDGMVHGSFSLPDDPNLTVSFAENPLATIGQGQTMEIAELLDVVGASTDAEASSIETYLLQKYLIPVRDH